MKKIQYTKICVFGDSISWGAWDLKEKGWCERLKSYFIIKDRLKMIYNCSVLGDSTKELLFRFDVECKFRNPKIIIFAIGINDCRYVNSKRKIFVSIKEFEKNINELIKKSKKITNKVLFVGLNKIDENKTNPCFWKPNQYYIEKDIKLYNEKIKEICKKKNITFIDIYNQVNKKDIYDGIHLNQNGHKKIFIKVKKELYKNNF